MLIKKLQGSFEQQNGYHYEFDMHSNPLGEGGMGIVYKGFRISDSSGVRSAVAIKVMYEGLPSEIYERAEREASIRLKNDNLLEMLGFIYEVEIDAYGLKKDRYYVISEYLDGIVLSDLLEGQIKDKDGNEPAYAKQLYNKYISDREKTSTDIVKCILSGISALHDKGYIHRDIDPTNIMVTNDGVLKLIDFGIAKYVHSLGTTDKSLTSTGKFIGKVEFASPELVLGDVRNQGYHTDIYAIGILFYRLLVGKLPFEGNKYEVLQMQLNDKVPTKPIKNPLLANIIKKATEKKKSDRYSSVAEIRADIDKVESTTPSFFKRYKKQVLVTLLSCIVCIFLIYWLMNRPVVPTPPPPLPVQIEKGFVSDFNNALAKLDSDEKITANEGLRLMKELADKNCIEAKNELGITYCTFEKVQSPLIMDRRDVLGFGEDVSEVLSIQYLEDIKESQLVSADALYVLGYSYWRYSKWEDAKIVLTKAMTLITKSPQSNYHGFSKDELEKNIKYYLRLCNKEINK